MKQLNILLYLLFITLLPVKLYSQPLTPKENGLTAFQIKDPTLGPIRFYLASENLHQKLPLLIEVNGSGGLPLCMYIKGKGFSTISNTFNQQLKEEAVKKGYHYLILDKPGTPFCDSISTGDNVHHFDAHALIAGYHFSEEYNRRLSLNWRVEATKKVITYLVQHGYWDHSQIVAYGYSEGAQVVPALAVADKKVTHVVAIVGSGLNQFYDGIINWRIKAAKGELTQQQAQDSIDAQLKQIQAIYRQPKNTKLQY